MDCKMFRKIQDFASDISTGKSLEGGLETAQKIYQSLDTEIAKTPEEIAKETQVSAETVKQSLLALRQEGTAKIKIETEKKNKTGRPVNKYRKGE